MFLIAQWAFSCYNLKQRRPRSTSYRTGKGDVMSEQRYVEIPGSRTHELPPLLLHCSTDTVADLASVMLEAEDMLLSTDVEREILEQRKLDLALQLTEQYKGLVSHWLWGDSVIEWIRQ